MARQRMSIPSTFTLDWQALPTTDGNVPGPVFKVLSADPDSGGSTILLHLPPGWRDDVLDWHPCSEEGLILAGLVTLADRRYTPGVYLYRPPGILHGPAAALGDDGATIIQRFDSELRILRYTGDEFPHRDLQAITRQADDWPIEWVERLDPEERPWATAEGGAWAGARYKWLARDRRPGAGGSILLDLREGWEGREYAAHGEIEEFVLTGDVDAGGERFERWGYACRPKGSPAGGLSAPEGARLICWWQMNELDD
jgi:hypothetical protein